MKPAGSTTTKLPGRKPSPKLPFAKDPNFISSEMLDRISQKFEKRVKVVLCGVPGSGLVFLELSGCRPSLILPQ